jgi:putative transposase
MTTGDLELMKLRTGSFFPSLLEQRPIDQALFAVVMEAYLHGSRRGRSMTSCGLGAGAGTSRSEVSGSAPTSAGESERLPRPFADRASLPYVFLDATYCKARVNRRVVTGAVAHHLGGRRWAHRSAFAGVSGRRDRCDWCDYWDGEIGSPR